ncbi:DUF6484 domain-containing protein [Pseudomonas paralcaligenes]|uniref:DUF6484 domain-containing protein n=1 Tax=Pseudomonas paralcaligenes TaxID=2772558 RepID=UPI001C81801D|nr:DUF6484 domain-containing protein [Pseudomonas paralcaligenes]
MKTDAMAATEPTVGLVSPSGHPLDDLLRRPTQVPPPERAEGIAIGRLEQIDEEGHARVAIDIFGLSDVCAQTLISLTPDCIGQAVALGFESSDPQRPIVLGLLLTAAEPNLAISTTVPEIRREGARLIVEAETELELRCGDAVILLEAGGQVVIRGVSITSHASAAQRIRGGSVQIN